jgi:type II secretory pathway pseudopilin PulG
MQYNTCHNRNLKLIITILQEYSTGLQRFPGIKTKFKFKYKLQTKKTKKKKLKQQQCGPISLKETGPAVDDGLAHKGTQIRPNSPNGGPSADVARVR